MATIQTDIAPRRDQMGTRRNMGTQELLFHRSMQDFAGDD